MTRIPTHSIRGLLALSVLLAGAGGLLAPRPAVAEDFTYTILLEGGVGGPVNEEPGDSTGFETGFQLGFSVVAADGVHVGGRVGRIEYEPGDVLGPFIEPTLDYFTVGGDYRFSDRFYQSGVFLGLGYYRLEGDVLTDISGTTTELDETGVGLAVGVTGEFELAPKVGFQIEIIGHITDLDANDLFATAHAGFAFHF